MSNPAILRKSFASEVTRQSNYSLIVIPSLMSITILVR